MSLQDSVEGIGRRLDVLEKVVVAPPPKKKVREVRVKVPGGLARWGKKGSDRFVGVLLGADKGFRWVKVEYRDGLLWCDGRSWEYDASAVFFEPKKKVNVVVLFSWRLSPVGGKVEERVKMLHADEEERVAYDLGLTNYGQQTIIRSLKQAEADLSPKKSFGVSPILWLMGGVLVVYLISRMFG